MRLKFPFSRLLKKRTRTQSAQSGPVDLFSEEAFQNPFPLWAQLRANQPIAEVASGGYALSRYDDVLAAFQNKALQNTPSRFSILKEANAAIHESADYARHAIPFRDGDAHMRIRRACLHALSSNPHPSFDTCVSIAGNLIHLREAERDQELIQDFATPFVDRVMSTWFNLPEADAPQLGLWSQSIFRLFAPLSDRSKLETINNDVRSFRNYLSACYDNDNSESGLLFSIKNNVDNHGGDLQDAIDNAILIYMDGIENIRYAAGSVMLEVSKHPALVDKISISTEIAEAVTQEALRMHTPASIISRVAANDLRIQNVEIKKGTPVYLLLGSANRDESAFENADTFMPNRSGRALLIFGHGAHSCLGGNAAITMIGALIQSLLQNGYILSPNKSPVSYVPRFGHRWPEAIPLQK